MYCEYRSGSLPISTAASEEPRSRCAYSASFAARAGSYSFRLTPRITFQPLALTNVDSAVRSEGVIVPIDQDGAVSPLEVQKVSSTVLPPMRSTEEELSVSRYVARSPEAKPGNVRSSASKDRPADASVNDVPVVVGLIVITDVAADAGEAAASSPAAGSMTASAATATARRAGWAGRRLGNKAYRRMGGRAFCG